jgi:hypothetical protein
MTAPEVDVVASVSTLPYTRIGVVQATDPSPQRCGLTGCVVGAPIARYELGEASVYATRPRADCYGCCDATSPVW